LNLKDIEAQYASSAESSDSDSEAETDEGKIDASVQQNDEGLEKEENQDNIEESTEDNIPTEEMPRKTPLILLPMMRVTALMTICWIYTVQPVKRILKL
jgi:hypothetical protein